MRAEASDIEVSFDPLERALAAGFEVVDVRETHELQRLATPCSAARHLPIAELLHGSAALPPSGRYLFVCASGKRSLAAAQELRARGYERAFSLRGGIAALTRSAAISTA